MEALVVTVFTRKRHVIVVKLLVMIVHGVLILLGFATMLANKETIFILFILIDHKAVWVSQAVSVSIFAAGVFGVWWSKLLLQSLEKGMPEITILTLAIGADFIKNLEKAFESKVSYAARHGYKYIQGGENFWDRSRPIPWSKIPFVLAQLEKLPEGALVWLSDADVLITNPLLRIEDQMVSLLPEGKDLLMCIDACGHINSGNVLMRNTAWTRDYWKRVGEQTDLLYHIWWENAAMIKLLETVPNDLAHTEITNQHKRFNAYLRALPGQPLWEPGDFLVHFAGVYDGKEMRNLIQKIQAGYVPRLEM